jgi:hypothetical protein
MSVLLADYRQMWTVSRHVDNLNANHRSFHRYQLTWLSKINIMSYSMTTKK